MSVSTDGPYPAVGVRATHGRAGSRPGWSSLPLAVRGGIRLVVVALAALAPVWLPASGAVAGPGAPGQPAFTGAVQAEPVAPGAGGELPAGWFNTQWGPVGPGDIALIEGVRRADLWEGAAGKMAVDKGVNPVVKEIGANISRQHLQELDPLTLKIGTQLGVPVPDAPNTDQQRWLAELRQATGVQFDQIFVDRLRAAHGKVFALIASVRANTRNDLVREYASTCNKYVDNHMRFLDSTGLTRFNELPTPAAPAAAAPVKRGFVSSDGTTSINRTVVWVILLVGGVAGVAATMRIFRPR